MDFFGMDNAPDVEPGMGTGTMAPTPNVGSWFQRGSTHDAALSDRGIGIPINAMLDRVRESDALTYDQEDED